MILLSQLTLLTILPCFAENDATDTKPPQLVWAHYVGWGFPFSTHYDQPEPTLMRLYDRPLLGNGWASCDSGVSSTTRNEILAAMQYSIDGFTVDIPLSKNYASTMSRFYRAAEGLSFYVALCIDGWDAGPTEMIVEHLTEYFQRWGNHPNNYYINGKPVIFLYSIRGKTLEESAKILSDLKDKGHEAFWIIQPARESSSWNDAEKLRKMLEIFDGFYDFGRNGVPPEQMVQTLRNGRNALRQANRVNGGVLVGGITQGYNGGHNAFYRPFCGTGTLRQNWDAIMVEPCDWVCITTWNDYWENTQFGHSDWVRDTLLQINREFVLKWRKATPPPRPPRTFIAYKNEVRLGDDWTLEILGFPYTTVESVCHTRLLDMDGKIVKNFEPISLATDKPTLFVHRLKTLGINEPRYLRLQASVSAKNQLPETNDWKELYPIVVRPGIMRDFQTVRIALHDLLPQPTPQLVLQQNAERLIFRSSIEAWSWIGRVELLCNGKPIANREIAATNKGPRTSFDFSVAKTERQPRDLYTLRLTRLDGQYIWSTPVLLAHTSDNKKLSTCYFRRFGDFDECWFRGVSSPTIMTTSVFSDEVYGFSFALDDDPNCPKDRFGWNIAAVGGGTRGKAHPNAVPQFIEETNSASNNEQPKRYFSFDGNDDRILLQTTSFPTDAVKVSLWVRPKKIEQESYMFSDQNNALNLGVLPNGQIFAERGQTRIISERKINIGDWIRLEARYDGCTLDLRIDNSEWEKVNCPPSVYGINSIPAIGCRHVLHLNFRNHFNGDLAELMVEGQ
ncbi:MAG: hypothetical protein LBI18_15910 [Planctomycetaceae bacterium]|nr:hypothetical protein [Planctomycetaceae bacterium]